MKKTFGTLIRELLFAGGAVLLITCGVWLLSEDKRAVPVASAPKEKQMAQETGTGETETFDADRDGLPDWEEALWGTNRKLADTDGDGATDGAEVAAHRNPKKAGPHDSLEGPVATLPKEDIPLPTKTSSSIKEITEKIALPSLEIQKLPENPVKIEDNPEKDALHTFGNTLGALIQTAMSDSTAELAFWNSAAGNTKMNTKLIQEFVTLAQKYSHLASDIASVASPPKGTDTHKKLVTTYQNYAKAIQTISETEIDSYMSEIGVTAYSNATIALGHAFVDVSDLFYRKGIHFSPTEPGSIFVFPR